MYTLYKCFEFGQVENFVGCQRVDSIPNNKILDMTNLKAFADDKLIVAKMTISVFDREENTGKKGENTGYQHFLLFSLPLIYGH